ncbi:MAG: Aspartyl/glutamyl-tRNA(Asn/Gln) amidotransferase subunit B [candidate division TM6 bacterium GW2011_GWF2_38_10]|nr:MAG: Aspartyl/glutamyl-tRNA(Asn/Gln) amidotransferase subunit B [candidate division TM6 bacterium GW2011_GWF2_38_10]
MAENIISFLDQYPDYQATIGIEVHVQLKTASKIFCSCKNEFGGQSNTHICPICVGHPGTLPTLNAQVVDYALALGLATNCSITRSTDFARKHYMYPDLPKNYQITQDENPMLEDTISCYHSTKVNILSRVGADLEKQMQLSLEDN